MEKKREKKSTSDFPKFWRGHILLSISDDIDTFENEKWL